LTSGWWSEFSVIALLSLAIINIKISMKLFFTIFFFSASVGRWTQTLDLRMMKRVICPYASVAHHNQHQDFNETIFLPFFFFGASVGSWTQTLDLRMMKQVICPYTSVIGHNQYQDFNEIISLPFVSLLLVLEAGLKPLTSGW
jgi:hypothetical protein